MADVERMYINGEWTYAEGGATFDVVNPADRTVVGRVTNGAVPDVGRAVAAAHTAFRDWSALAPKDRGRFLLRIQELMEERRGGPAAAGTPLTGLAIAKVAEDAGLPAGVFNVLTTNRSGLVGAELLTHPLIRKIGFTGSTEVGKGIMETAARQIKRLSFELGGNAPFIVFEDADFKAALDGAVAMKFLRVAGQSCICANRIYVQRSIADRFVPAFVDAVKGLKVAPGFEPGAQLGPLINEETRAKVHALVEDAVTRGARLVTGGHYLRGERYAKGFFYAPAVLLDVADDMPIAQEEIFGPAAPVLTFDTEEEVIRRANATKFGLAAYFYTRDMTRLVRVAEQLEYGLVGANDAAGYTHEIPFGGFKESGLGREGGHEGIEEYTEVKSVVVNLG